MDTDVGVEWMKTVEVGDNYEDQLSHHHHHLLSPPEAARGSTLNRQDAVFVNYDDDGDGMTQK